MTYAKIRQLIRCVNRLREPALKLGKYTLVSQVSVRLVLMLPKEFTRPNKIVARGVIDIENYLRQELAELEAETDTRVEMKGESYGKRFTLCKRPNEENYGVFE